MAKRSTTAQAALFDEPEPLAEPQGGGPSAAAALRVQPATAKTLSPAAKAFNLALQKIEKLQAQIDELERTCLAHQAALAQSVQPLREQHRAAIQQLLGRLCAHIDADSPLSKTQRTTLRDVVCGLAVTLMDQGVPDMEALHDRYSPQTLAHKRKQEAEAMRARLDHLMGQFTGEDLNIESDVDDPEAMLHAALAQLRAQAEQEAAQREARTQARKARQAKRAPSAQQQQAAQALQDADASLRQIYRQLASALHPDREPDPTERQRKNTLMGEANAAYERKDLVALLRLQLQAELVDPDHLERVSTERLQQLTLLLKQQSAALDKQRQQEQQRWMAQLGLPWGMPVQPAYLRQCLNAEVQTWKTEIRGVQADLQDVDALATLKPWLNAQRRLAQAAQREADLPMGRTPFDNMPW
jgi:hypothetical protein